MCYHCTILLEEIIFPVCDHSWQCQVESELNSTQLRTLLTVFVRFVFLYRFGLNCSFLLSMNIRKSLVSEMIVSTDAITFKHKSQVLGMSLAAHNVWSSQNFNVKSLCNPRNGKNSIDEIEFEKRNQFTVRFLKTSTTLFRFV